MNVLHVVAVVLNVIALLLGVLEVGLPYWFWVDVAGTKRSYYGLWEICASVNYDDYVCRSFGAASISVEDWWDANAGMQVLAMCFLFLALVAGFTAFCCMNKPVLLTMSGILSVLAAVCGLIGIIIFGIKFDDDNNMDASNLHASFYIALFTVVFALVAGIFYFLAKPTNGNKRFN